MFLGIKVWRESWVTQKTSVYFVGWHCLSFSPLYLVYKGRYIYVLVNLLYRAVVPISLKNISIFHWVKERFSRATSDSIKLLKITGTDDKMAPFFRGSQSVALCQDLVLVWIWHNSFYIWHGWESLDRVYLDMTNLEQNIHSLGAVSHGLHILARLYSKLHILASSSSCGQDRIVSCTTATILP